MKQLQQTNKFEKDLSRMKRRRIDLNILEKTVLALLQGEPLEPKHRDHALTGDWKLHRECHLAPDWLLIYKSNEEFVRLERTGSHSDLFQ